MKTTLAASAMIAAMALPAAVTAQTQAPKPPQASHAVHAKPTPLGPTSMRYKIRNATAHIWINGQDVGTLSGDGQRDVSSYFHHGQRVPIRVAWSGTSPQIELLFGNSVRNNYFRGFWAYKLHGSKQKQGDHTYHVLYR